MSRDRGLAWVLVPLAAALMGAAAFEPARPGYVMAFPRDHAAHPRARTEWWYYTGNLQGPGGRAFGYQLTFFRVGVGPGKPLGPRPSRLRAGDVHLAHLAVTDVGRAAFAFDERLQRGGTGLAWALPTRYEVVNGTWEAALRGDVHRLSAAGAGLGLALDLVSLKPPVRHGAGGYSRKGGCDTCASQYYSLTRMRTKGALTVGGARVPVEGLSWMDHEWGSNQLQAGQAGWDWFSVQLADGAELMLYQLRGGDGTPDPASSGTFVRPDGTWRHLPAGSFSIVVDGAWASPASRARYPAAWTLQVPGERLRVALRPRVADQELRTAGSTGETYWEGAVEATGTRAGKPVAGAGYVELTGYATPFKARI